MTERLTLTDAVDALKGLYGLLQLRNASDPGWESNHRAVDARRVMALAEAHGTAPLPETGTHTDHPLRHFDRTCPACTEGDTPRTDAAARAEAVIAAAERVSHLPSELCDFIREQAALLTEHRDNGRRLMESADGWKAEAERLRGIERALERANEEIASQSARPCTCHPDDNPPRPCPQKYALTECREAAARSTIQPSLGEQVAWVATDPGGGRVLFWKHTFDAEWVAEHYPNAEPLYALSATGTSKP